MNVEKYFKKNGCIYAIFYRDIGNEWVPFGLQFTDLDMAKEWINRKSKKNHGKELVSKTHLRNCGVYRVGHVAYLREAKK
ncbi:MAG: hypothetical protein K6D02_01850 [Lachnospiraceae bacterium]|nr:hypothetical protein [Lachnospiraceae bacterium]